MQRAPNSGTVPPADPEILELSEFVRGMAHEIANPFNAIAMNVELTKYLLERNQTVRAAEVLERLMSECTRCANLLQGMQRFGSGLHAQSPSIVDVRERVDAAIELARENMRGNQPAMHVQTPPKVVKIRADSPALQSAIAELLHNAAEAGSKNVHIQIQLEDDQAVIDCRDDGQGVAEEIRARLGEAFFSTRRSDGGCGLGLTLVRAMLRRHNGTMHIVPNEGGGTAVTLRIPTGT